jgi:hypothetical protein
MNAPMNKPGGSRALVFRLALLGAAGLTVLAWSAVRLRRAAAVPPPGRCVADSSVRGAGAGPATNSSAYAEVRNVGTGFREARGLAVTPDGRIYAAGDRSVRIFGPDAEPASFEVPGAPGCLAVSRDGLLYLGMGDHVEVFDHCGGAKARWEPAGSNSVVTCIAVGAESIWVADAGRREILRYTRGGALAGRVAGRVGPDDGNALVVPSPHLDVAEDAAGRVWVANPGRHRFQVYVSNGVLTAAWGFFSNEDPAGFTGCCNPADFALTPEGDVVAADKGELARVRIYSPDGRLKDTVADVGAFDARGKDCRGRGHDVAVDARGRIYALDPAANRIRVYAKKDGGHG